MFVWRIVSFPTKSYLKMSCAFRITHCVLAERTSLVNDLCVAGGLRAFACNWFYYRVGERARSRKKSPGVIRAGSLPLFLCGTRARVLFRSARCSAWDGCWRRRAGLPLRRGGTIEFCADGTLTPLKGGTAFQL